MSKKFLKVVLCLMVMISSVTFVRAQNQQGPFESFVIEGLEDGKVQTGDKLTFIALTYEDFTNINVIFNYENWSESINFNLIKTADHTYKGTYTIPESFKYIQDKIEFIYLDVWASTNGFDYSNYYYSCYSENEIYDKLGYEIEKNPLIKIDENLSFEISDYILDEKAPELLDYDVIQEGSKIRLELEIEDDISGFSSGQVGFDYLGNQGYGNIYIPFDENHLENGKYVAELELNESGSYQYNSYGIYSMSYIELCDHAANRIYINENIKDYKIELKEEDNVLENFEPKNVVLDTPLGGDAIFLRVESGYGARYANLQYPNPNGENVYLAFLEINPNDFDLSVVGNYVKSYEIEVRINNQKSERYTIDVPVEIVEVVGEIVYYNLGWEVCLTYEELKNIEIAELSEEYGYAKLYTGETVKIDMVCNGAGMGPMFGTDSDTNVEAGAMMMYHPKYKITENEQEECYLTTKFIFHLIDEQGNLVDLNGDIIKKYADREIKEIEAVDKDISIHHLEGALPSYTTIVTKEVTDLDSIFKSDYVAYDISLDARFAVQPNGDVTVNIHVPEEMKNKKLEVCYVDDHGKKTFMSSNCEKGIVSFETNHFSTYVVVEKLYGDVNADGKVNTEDRRILARTLAGWDEYLLETIDKSTADVNDDGKINAEDRLILTRHLAGWEEYETLPH